MAVLRRTTAFLIRIHAAIGARRAARLLISVAMLLAAAGIVTLASASRAVAVQRYGDALHFVKRQLAWLACGVAAACVAAALDYRFWRRYAVALALFCAGSLTLVLLIGPEIHGSQRWLRFGPLNFQPSELAKFVAVVMTAGWLSHVRLRIRNVKEGLLMPGLALGLVLFLILLEPDVGTVILIGAAGAVLLYVSGTRAWPLILGAVAAAVVVGIYVRCDPVRWERILAWLYPERYPAKAAQYLQARKAFVLGGLEINPGGGIQKYFYLPEVHTDFIFAVVGEEFGFIGTFGVLAAFAGFLLLGTLVSFRAPDLFGRLLGAGITLMMTMQAVTNVAVATGMIPTTGMSLPFFSYGGSSLFMSCFQVGVLVNIGRQGGEGPDPP
ncbi:MAG: cell division protein FtsW [Kiritimatiellae bacterium]|nr:cell division protein FtsW [Kiritimatiellia bacterium]